MVKNLKVMARMGVYFEEEVQRRYPEFPRAKGRMELGRLPAADEWEPQEARRDLRVKEQSEPATA